jgi:hypothetical protein
MAIAECIHKIMLGVDFSAVHNAMSDSHPQVCGNLLYRILWGNHVADFSRSEHFTYRKQGKVMAEGDGKFSIGAIGTMVISDSVHEVFSPLLF